MSGVEAGRAGKSAAFWMAGFWGKGEAEAENGAEPKTEGPGMAKGDVEKVNGPGPG